MVALAHHHTRDTPAQARISEDRIVKRFAGDTAAALRQRAKADVERYSAPSKNAPETSHDP